MTPISPAYSRDDLIAMIHNRDGLISDLKQVVEDLRAKPVPVAESEILLSSLHRQLKAVADHPEHYWIGQILLDTLKREAGYIADSRPSDPAQEPEAVALDIADEFILVCEAAARQAKRLGNTFVLDRQRVANLIQAKLTRLTRPVSLDREAVFQAAYKNASSALDEGDIETQTENITDAILALIEGRT